MVRERNDTEYTVVVPKYDNSGRKIEVGEIEDVAKDMSGRFGGVTINPSVLGCWENESDELLCEENVAMSSVRQSEDDTPAPKDDEWMEDLASKIGDEFGQASVFVSEDVVESEFVSGDFKEELGKDKVGRKPFEEMI